MPTAVAAVLVALLAAGCASASKGGWGIARPLPFGANDQGFSISCVTPGDCFLFYSVISTHPHRLNQFAVSLQRGAVGRPHQIPGSVQMNGAGYACAAPGDCIAAGTYHGHAAAASEDRGAWTGPREVPGVASLGTNSRIGAFTCSTAGWCSAAGTYQPPGRFRIGNDRSFVVTERGGAWRAAEPVPGLADLNGDGPGSIAAISCVKGGTCTGVGYYSAPGGRLGLFAATERSGVWRSADEITAGMPGAAPWHGGTLSASCTAPGNCTSAGTYDTGIHTGPDQVFTVTETDGVWGRPLSLPGTAALRKRFGNAVLTGLSCAAPGQCAVAGYYTLASGNFKYSAPPTVPFLAAQVNGRWGSAHGIPALGALHPGAHAAITSLSCGAPGFCIAAGSYTVPGSVRAFLITETHGTWGDAAQVPGRAGLDSGGSAINWVGCWSARRCVAIGIYHTGSLVGRSHLFVTTRR